jgi:hypothetical protein
LSIAGTSVPGFAQTDTGRSGFAIMTVVSGNIAGIVASENLRNETGAGVEQAIVAPSVLLTAASMLVQVGPIESNTTALAIANPSLGAGAVNLVLTNKAGAEVLNRTIMLRPREHFSRFINELFAMPPRELSTPFLLTVTAEIPVAIVAFNFRAGAFLPIPLTSLSNPTPVPVQPLVPETAPGSIVARGVPTAAVSPPIFVSPGDPRSTATVSIGGGASLLFAEVAVGGGWSTELVIGNTSAGAQNLRIDFFGAEGALVRSISDIVIPSRGVFTVSTD